MRLACAIAAAIWFAASCAHAMGPPGPNQGQNQGSSQAASTGSNQAASPGSNPAASPGSNQAAAPGAAQAAAEPSQGAAEPQGQGQDGMQDHWSGLAQFPAPAPAQTQAQTPDLIQIEGAHFYFHGFQCNAAPAVRQACNGKSTCSVRADNRLCGDPGPSEANALGVTYRCGKARKIASALGDGWADLNCR
jgi:hypothetical protein